MYKKTKISINLSTIDYKKLLSIAKRQGFSAEEFILHLIYETIYKNKKPNKKTLKAMEDAEKGIGLKFCKNIDEMWKSLGLE